MTIAANRINYYFIAGVDGIKERLRETGCCVDYYFSQLEGWRDVNFIADLCLHIPPLKNQVIICRDELLPLALYFFKNTKNILAVFSSNSSVDEIINELSIFGIHLKHHHSERWERYPTLTGREHSLLNLFFSGHSIVRIACKLNIPVKTVYYRLSYIKHKMKIRNLEVLLCH